MAAVLALLAVIACARTAARSQGSLRAAWTLLAAGILLRAASSQLAGVTAVDTPTFWTLLLSSGSALLLLAGVLRMPVGERSASRRIQAVLDGLVAAGALLFIGYALLQPVIEGLADPIREALPLLLGSAELDVVVAGVAVAASGRIGLRSRATAPLLAAGLVLLAAVGSGALVALVQTGIAATQLTGIAIAAAYLLMAAAALFPGADRAEMTADSAPSGMAGALLALLTVVAAATVAATGPPLTLQQTPVRFLVGAATAALFVAREVVMLADNRSLHRSLLRRVHQRTRELAEATQRQEAILSAAGEGIFGVAPDGTVLFANPAAARLMGTDVEGLVGRPLTDVFHGGAADRRWEQHPVRTAVVEDRAVTRTDESFVRHDGTAFPVQFTACRVEEAGRLLGAVVVFRDITEQRQLERMKDEFVAVASHELRTPLTAIRGALVLVASGRLGHLDAQLQRLVDMAVDNTDRLNRLVNDLLDLQRLESGRVELDLARHDLVDLVGRAVELMQAAADEHGVHLRADVAPLPVDVDGDRLVQVLTNLLSNAIKFSPEGGVVTVAARPNPEGVEVAVSDEGRGIPPDQLEAVFERFHQVNTATRRTQGGTGLGLSICRTIVEQHGGRIWAESGPGRGTTVRCLLPRRPARDGAGTQG